MMPRGVEGFALRTRSLLGVAFFTACSSVAHDPLPPTTAFVNVNVIPMDREGLLEDYTVLVEGDRIFRMGPASDLHVPEGAHRIDGRGRYLMPGLADNHVHVWTEDHLWLLLANGITHIRNMWGMPIHLRWQDEIEKGTRIAPSIYTVGPLMDGPGAYWPGSTVLTTPEEAREAVERAHADGYPALKVYSKLSVEVYDAIVEMADELGLRVEGHVPIAVGLERALASDQLSSEHLTGFNQAVRAESSPMPDANSFSDPGDWVRANGEIALRIRAGELSWADVYDPERITKVAAAVARSSMWVVPTLVVFKDLPREEALAAFDDPQMRFVDAPTKKSWHPDRNEFTASVGDELLQAAKLWQEHRRRLVRALHEAGAGLLLGTDCMNPLVVPGFSIHDELEELVACGLTPYEALVAGTEDAADFLDQSGEWGTVEVGGRADLLLLEANPLDDVAHARERVGVMVRGRWLPEAELSGRLERLAEKYEKQEGFYSLVFAGDIGGAWGLRRRWYQELGTDLVNETEINAAGYALLAEERFEEAIELFTRNAQAYPRSGNTWDSLAEAYLSAGQFEPAIEYYERSLAVDPSNTNAESMLRELRSRD